MGEKHETRFIYFITAENSSILHKPPCILDSQLLAGKVGTKAPDSSPLFPSNPHLRQHLGSLRLPKRFGRTENFAHAARARLLVSVFKGLYSLLFVLLVVLVLLPSPLPPSLSPCPSPTLPLRAACEYEQTCGVSSGIMAAV